MLHLLRSRPRRVCRVIAVLAAVLTILWGGRTQAEPLRIRYAQAYSALQSVFALPILVAERQGYFVQEGLAFSMLPVAGGGEALVRALHDGTADLAHVATPFLIQAALKGSDAVAINAEFNNPIYTLVAKPEIKSYADLKGKLIAIAAEKGSITLSIRKLLTSKGLARDDVRTIFVDGTPDRLKVLMAGEVDAAILGQPQDFTAMRRGFHVLGDSTEVVPEYVYTVSAVRRGWGNGNKEAVVRFVRAIASALRFVRDPARRAEAIRTITDTTGLSETTARMTLELYLDPDRGVLPKAGEISLSGLKQVIDLMAAGGVLTAPLPEPERFVDLQYLKAAGLQ